MVGMPRRKDAACGYAKRATVVVNGCTVVPILVGVMARQ